MSFCEIVYVISFFSIFNVCPENFYVLRTILNAKGQGDFQQDILLSILQFEKFHNQHRKQRIMNLHRIYVSAIYEYICVNAIAFDWARIERAFHSLSSCARIIRIEDCLYYLIRNLCCSPSLLFPFHEIDEIDCLREFVQWRLASQWEIARDRIA